MKPYYQHEKITIYHGDCRDVLPQLETNSFRLCWTDPPYGHGNQDGDLQSSRVGVKGARQRDAEPIANDGDQASMRAVVDAALSLVLPLMKTDCCCCCCCCGGGPKPSFAWLAERMDREGLAFFHALIWDKTKRGPGMGWRFRRDYEMVMVAHRSGSKLAWKDPDFATSNILRFHPEPNQWHPTTKPLAMCADMIRWTTSESDAVIDPFMGSGTILVAAKNLGRAAVGIEIDERHCESAAERLSQEILALA